MRPRGVILAAVATQRVRTGELMDDPGLDREAHEHALRSLGRAAAVSGTAASMWPAIRRAAARQPNRPLRVLDIACGGGDVAVAVARRLASAGLAGEVVGCDVSPVALEYATARAARVNVGRVRFTRLDVLRDPWPAGFDVVMCSLFLHHLSDDDAVTLLRRMGEAAGQVVVVSDLQRTTLGAVFAWAGCRLLSRSRVFHVDGLRSVRAAFTADEARALAQSAGLQTATTTLCWPQRFVLTWTRDAS